jgi:hypothetical protein
VLPTEVGDRPGGEAQLVVDATEQVAVQASRGRDTGDGQTGRGEGDDGGDQLHPQRGRRTDSPGAPETAAAGHCRGVRST